MEAPRTAEHFDPNQWRRVQDLFEGASQQPAATRAAWLDRSCEGDAELRAELESLLAAAEGPAWLDQPVLNDLPPELSGDQPTVSMPRIDAPDSGPLARGQMLGPYSIVEKIGEGGMGAVYRATDTRLSRTVAIKVITLSGNLTDRKRFLLEARHASTLNHPNIVTIYEYENQDGLEFIVMEYIAGLSLASHLGTKAPLPQLLGYAVQVAAALESAHRAGIVHRDLKPANVMVTAEGAVKVLDFGLSRLAADQSGADQLQTLLTVGGTVGTPAYMSPEQVRGEKVDHRSDIFSFGIMLYEMACGRRPFGGTQGFQLLESIVSKPAPACASVAPQTPARLAELIDRCLARNKDERPASMAEVRTVLLSVLEEGEAGGDRRASPPANTWRRAGLAAVLLLFAAMGAIWFLQSRSSGPRRVLTYSLLTQRPGEAPQPASANGSFRGGDRFHLRVESPQAGFFYLINEGAGEGQQRRFWILHAPAAGKPQPPGQPFDTGTYVFDQNPGTERMWMVWAESAIPTVEEANRTARGGEVTDAAQSEKLKAFLSALPRAVAEPGGAIGERVQLRSSDGVLGTLVELRHQ